MEVRTTEIHVKKPRYTALPCKDSPHRLVSAFSSHLPQCPLWSWLYRYGKPRRLGTTSLVTTFPERPSAISSSHYTQFHQVGSPAGGSGYDATYDIFIDPTAGVANRNSLYEIMIWVTHKSPNKPISTSYDSSGNAVAYATGVSLAGKTWDDYIYK